MKKSLPFILGLFLINFVSAYNGFRSFLDRIDPQIIILGTLFLIFFAFINYVLSKIFKDKYGNVNKSVAGIIAFCISALAVYGIYRSRWGIGNWFYRLGVSETFLWVIGIIAFIILAFFIIKKLKICGFLLILGAALIIISFTDLIYQKSFTAILGIILFALGLWLCIKKRMKGKKNPKIPKSEKPKPKKI